MRNGIVDVQQIERGFLGHLQHFGGEGQSVGRVIEERVGGHFDFVKGDSLVHAVQADRNGVANKMNVVAASGELHAELCRNHAGTAIRWIAGDANFHGFGASALASSCGLAKRAPGSGEILLSVTAAVRRVVAVFI